ncbi:MAG TPA: hypothetical protein VHW67_10090 [Solirubrobacteraceae bacterium]|nr:hypothetical protein [Solirubrobacteraceae bacterium]
MSRRLPARPALLFALALATLAIPLLAAAPGLARPARATHASARSKSKRHHAKRTHRAKRPKKHKGRHKPAGGTTTVPAPSTPAVCEDGSKPRSEGEGLYSCSNGAEPVCSNGAEPTAAHGGAKLVCPPATSSNTEWNEAECEDGSSPERSGAGFVCEDGSRPSCEEGGQPTASEDGSMLVCIVHGAPAPSSPSSEEVEDEDDAAPVRAHVATGS